MAFLAAAATGKIPANAPAGKVYTFLFSEETQQFVSVDYSIVHLFHYKLTFLLKQTGQKVNSKTQGS